MLCTTIHSEEMLTSRSFGTKVFLPMSKPEENLCREANQKPEEPKPNSAPAPENIEALKKLTPEEQMALYEKALKEDDWGHQPC
jgi:hypothetical protein